MKKNNQIQKYSKNFQNKFLKDYLQESYLKKNFDKTKLIKKLKNSVTFEKYILEKLYKNNLIVKKNIKLENVHLYVKKNQFTKENSSSDITRNILTEYFFNKDKIFFNIYKKIIFQLKRELQFDFLYQKDPFLRFNFPTKKKEDNLLPHVDLALGHPPGEINIWLPITNVSKNNSMSISTLEYSNNFFSKYNFNFQKYIKAYNYSIKKKAEKILIPYVAKKGEAAIFDGRIMHKSLLNNSKKTRVSLDFRILPVIYEKSAKKYIGTGYLKQRFIRGKYYNIKNA